MDIRPSESFQYLYLPLLPAPTPPHRLPAPAPILSLPSRCPRRVAEQQAEKQLYRQLIRLVARPGVMVDHPYRDGWIIGPRFQTTTMTREPGAVRFSDGTSYPVAISGAELDALITKACQGYATHELQRFESDLKVELAKTAGLLRVNHRGHESIVSIQNAEGDWKPVITILALSGRVGMQAYLEPQLMIRHYTPAWAHSYFVNPRYEELHERIDEVVAAHNVAVEPDGDTAVTNWPEAQRFEADLRARLAGLGRIDVICRYGDYSIQHLDDQGLCVLFIQEQVTRVMMSEFIPYHQRLNRQPAWAEYYTFRARPPFWMKHLLKRLVAEHNAALVAATV